MIQASNLTKRFNGRTVVDNVSLQINAGSIFGLLGPNAAGKTTVIRMLCGVINKDNGNILINGRNVIDAKLNFGYVAQHFGQYEELSIWENLEFYARMYGVNNTQRLQSLLEKYALEPLKNQLAGTLSGGYQRRLALICALAHDPDVLFLDEPTAGIDPITRKTFWDDFYALSAAGKTLFITTHYMEEAQRCHQLGFMSEGKLIATGTPESITGTLEQAVVYTAEIHYQPEIHTALSKLPGMLLLNQFGDELRLVATPELHRVDLEKVLTQAAGKAVPLLSAAPNIEDVFIALTQQGANT